LQESFKRQRQVWRPEDGLIGKNRGRFNGVQSEGSREERKEIVMPSTITLVVPRAENEHVFLQLVVQAAIRAHRGDQLKSHEVKTDIPNDDGSGRVKVAIP
jgi:hypothetical protein